jgi:hypothetical protein
MVPSEYVNFFTTAATTGGALIGLLFVAISLAPERTVLASAPIASRVVAGSTFTALLNAFFISLGALLPNTNIGWFAISFSIIGIINSLSQGRTLLIPWPSWQNVLRRTWLTGISLFLYIVDEAPVSYVALSVLVIYIIALIRAWELLGAQRTGLMAWLNPLYDINKGNSEVSTQPPDKEKKDAT